MKKFKMIALSLLAFVLSISVFTGCGSNEMTELSKVDFSKAQTVTIEEVADKVTSENFDVYPYVEYSLIAKDIDLSGISLSAETDGQPKTIVDIDINGRFSFAVPQNALITITSPENVVKYLNGEVNSKITINEVEYNLKGYIYKSYIYLGVGDMKLKASLVDLISDFGDYNLANYESDSDTSDFMNSLAEIISYLNMPQKVVNGDYTYYKLTFDSTKLEQEISSLLGNFELIVGFDGDRLCKIYASCGENFVLSINFVESTNISQPTNTDEYIDFNDVNVTILTDSTAIFDSMYINLDANDSQTIKLGLLNISNKDVTFSATLCVDNNNDAVLNSILENSGFVLNTETNTYEYNYETTTLTTDKLVKFYDITLTAPEGVSLSKDYLINFYFSIGMPQ